MINYRLKKKVITLSPAIFFMILLPVVISYTAELPDPLKNHYNNQQMIYWNIRQITVSPIFDEPETTIVQFYFEKPHSLFIETSRQHIYAKSDTIWTYIIEHQQIQKKLGGYVFNPFDFVDDTQTYYRVVNTNNKKVTLKSVEVNAEPDSLEIQYNIDGVIERIKYLDINDNLVVYEIIDESFSKPIPEDNFLINVPDGVKIVDLDD